MERLVKELLVTVRQAVEHCKERERAVVDAESKKYWEGAANAYQCVVNAVEREYKNYKDERN